jgi:hypothetical protein
MANELEKTLRSTAAKIAQYVEDAATINVDTSYILVGPDGQGSFDQAKPGIRSVIRLDGDCETILPVQTGQSGQLEVNADMFEIHQQNVETAIEYRARMMSALLDVLKSYTG